MRYGVPYKGSKNSIAREIVEFLPSADTLGDNEMKDIDKRDIEYLIYNLILTFKETYDFTWEEMEEIVESCASRLHYRG